MNTIAAKSPIFELREAGQSPWLDFISRELLRSGKLKSLIGESGILGVTSNPTIFEQAINQPGSLYANEIQKLIRSGTSTFKIYDQLTISDIQAACDFFQAIFTESKGEHGFVSLEVDPGLAYDEEKTVREAIRLFKTVNRPNVMIKVPATPEGICAVRKLIAQGINVNITLIFTLQHYRDSAHAYLDGLNEYLKRGGDIHKVHSVASVFVSRFDTLIDKQLQRIVETESEPAKKIAYQYLMGKAAVANSKLIYQEFKQIFASDKFINLKSNGAWIQKLLWGSTGTKNPDYSDLMYVENLVGEETVNTMPKTTLDAFIDHGNVRKLSVEEDIPAVTETVQKLKALGFDLENIGNQLQKDGAKLFCNSFASLMQSIERIQLKNLKTAKVPQVFPMTSTIDIQKTTFRNLSDFENESVLNRFFQRDASLWKNEPEHQKVILNRLGWLDAPAWILGKLFEIDQLADEIRQEGIRDVVLFGMGGSSLAPEVMYEIFKKERANKIKLHILDTTDTASVLRIEKSIRFKTTLFIVASKSGSTVETTSQFRYFYSRCLKTIGKAKGDPIKNTGRHFIAITDPGSGLEKTAREKHFRKVFVNPSDIGGRYSALSFFGIVPVALAGVPVRPLLKTALDFLHLSQHATQLKRNPAIFLGTLLGQLALAGKNKMIICSSPSVASFAVWIEQLVAESTGKELKGIVPVIGENLFNPALYGKDHVFVSITLRGEKSKKLTDTLRILKKSGYTVIELEWPKREVLGAEFLRWEIATSFASIVLKINPFDEPNVKESKDITNRLLDQLKQTGNLTKPTAMASLQGGGLKVNGIKTSLEEYLSSFLSKVRTDSYIALLAYVERNSKTQALLQIMRSKLRKICKIPVLVGFGPRYLHSIGQLYKGGPRQGLFIEFLMQDRRPVAVPESHYSFGQLKMAQALGDQEAIKSKELPIVTFEVGSNPLPGLGLLNKLLTAHSVTRK